MEELVARIEAKSGIGPEAARKAIAIIVGYLDRHAPRERMEQLYAAVPDAAELADTKAKRGLFGNLLGDSLMGIYSDLTAAGLQLDQMQAAGEELMAFARGKIGDEAVDEIANSIPGLKQLL